MREGEREWERGFSYDFVAFVSALLAVNDEMNAFSSSPFSPPTPVLASPRLASPHFGGMNDQSCPPMIPPGRSISEHSLSPAPAAAAAAAAASAGDAGAFVTQSSAAAASAALGDLTVVVSRALGRAAQPRPSNLADLDKLLTFCGKSPAQAPSKAEPKRIESMASTLPAAAQSALILTPSVMGEANADLRCKVRSLFENLLVASLSRSMQQSSAYSRGAILAQEIEEGLFDKHRTAPPAAGKAATVRPELDAAAAKAYGSHAQTLQRNFKRWNDYLVRLPSLSSSLPLFLSSSLPLFLSRFLSIYPLFLLYFSSSLRIVCGWQAQGGDQTK